ncbi:MAG: insulinase family protein [Phycisphaerae bacterium]|nr:insulinase family protein [Phycisphaerae bacterium]
MDFKMNTRMANMFLALIGILSLAGCNGPAQLDIDSIDIPYTKHVLDNGLTLLVHEDHKAPIVAYNVWYHVGSKNEKPGRTGFAHLFEHLMFNGSEHCNDDFFKPMKELGATGLNGTTNQDRTNYFETVPLEALDAMLWMESDRMGFMTGAIDQAKLDEQRDVVQNEKRQYANMPYGLSWELVTKNTYPVGHPYSWTVIGEMEDLQAASLKDVHEWFNKYYGAANAVISIAGDVDTKEIIQKVEEYFGNIPSGPPLVKHQSWIAKMTGTHRQKIQDRVPQTMLIMVWNVPEFKSKENTSLQLLSDIMGKGDASRLHNRLVREEQLATSISSRVGRDEIGGQFTVRVSLSPGADALQVEQIVKEEIRHFITAGPGKRELAIAKQAYKTGFLFGIEQVGGFNGKANILARNETFTGDAGFYKTRLNWVAGITGAELCQVAQQWLTDGLYVLEVEPFGKYSTTGKDVARDKRPDMKELSDVKFPTFQRASLANGLKVILVERHSVPLIRADLLIDAGIASDSFAADGIASLTMEMLKEGTTERAATDIICDLSLLGAKIQTSTSLDTSNVKMYMVAEHLAESMAIFSEVIQKPSFIDESFKRLQNQRLIAIEREKNNPGDTVMRLIGRLLYGKGHIYDRPLTGSGRAEAVKALTVDDIKNYYSQWLRPNNSTLIIVGDTTMDQIMPVLEDSLGKWAKADVPQKVIQKVSLPKESIIYLIDRPGSLQSNICTEQLVAEVSSPDNIALGMAVDIFGGSFVSRLNLNIREDKGWSYGARGRITSTDGQRVQYVSTSVQSDKTAAAMAEIYKEYQEIISDRPPTAKELADVAGSMLLTQAGRWETNESILGSLGQLVTDSLPDDYYDTLPAKVKAQSVQSVADAAQAHFYPDQLVWIVVGDLAQIEADIRKLDMGKVVVIDADGQPAR